MPAAIAFRKVTLTVADGRRLLDDLSLVLEEGSTTAVLGRSGAGKTTLLRLVNRLIDPTEGSVLVQGRDVAGEDVTALRRGIGYVIQETGLFPHFTVARNVEIVPEVKGASREERAARGRELLERVGLAPGEFAQRYPHQLSGGQRQRVGVARALAADPSILLMDEPLGALDPLTRAEMQQMLRDLLRQLKKTVLMVTHDLEEALYLADRIVLMGAGRVLADLPAHDFLNAEHEEVRAYVKAFRRGEDALQSGAAGGRR
ncbi:ATP-binding cassette domain-containing protein [Paracidobacterium acidisoli]|uniref:ATP-binding cassette domain-containing protein n=1 Tax=Paracidobacterium acidisoli TaxID=2303751 RepID=A0A372ISU4_9BACT|nr:ATP-binding cassette domain-containing protein [Paracidobacterium acidisoli]MBT9330701.1 ATP-binding cassette domain-containing protein [Paracidobacterium acidisoli]